MFSHKMIIRSYLNTFPCDRNAYIQTHELIQRGGNTIVIQRSNNVQLWLDKIQSKCGDSETCEHSGKLWAWQDDVRITVRYDGIVYWPHFTGDIYRSVLIRLQRMSSWSKSSELESCLCRTLNTRVKPILWSNLSPETRTCSTCMHMHACTHKHMHTVGQCLGLVRSSPRRLHRSWKYRHDHPWKQRWEWSHLPHLKQWLVWLQLTLNSSILPPTTMTPILLPVFCLPLWLT